MPSNLEEIEKLVAQIGQVQAVMTAVATGGPRINDKEAEYRDLYVSIESRLNRLQADGIAVTNPNNFRSLWDWYGHWSSRLPTYALRREYAAKLDTEASDTLSANESILSEYRFLPLTVGVETLGGVATPLILRGSPLPAKRVEVFTTAVDNQTSVEVKVFIGESPVARNNKSLGTFHLIGIPQAPRGIPQIAVTFEVERDCSVKVSALEKSSSRRMDVTYSGADIHLTRKEIDSLLKQATTSRVQDESYLRLVEARNKAEKIMARAESYLRENQRSGMGSSRYSEVERSLAALGVAIEINETEMFMRNPDIFGLGDLGSFGRTGYG